MLFPPSPFLFSSELRPRYQHCSFLGNDPKLTEALLFLWDKKILFSFWKTNKVSNIVLSSQKWMQVCATACSVCETEATTLLTSSWIFLRNSISSIKDSIFRSSSRRANVASSTSWFGWETNTVCCHSYTISLTAKKGVIIMKVLFKITLQCAWDHIQLCFSD